MIRKDGSWKSLINQQVYKNGSWRRFEEGSGIYKGGNWYTLKKKEEPQPSLKTNVLTIIKTAQTNSPQDTIRFNIWTVDNVASLVSIPFEIRYYPVFMDSKYETKKYTIQIPEGRTEGTILTTLPYPNSRVEFISGTITEPKDGKDSKYEYFLNNRPYSTL